VRNARKYGSAYPRHQRDRTKRPNSAPPDEQIEARLTEVIHPATLNQVAYFHELGLRERTLNLPVMMAFVLSLIWRHLGSVTEAVRVLKHEGLLWVDALKVSQQAVEQRLGSLPAQVFERVLGDILPAMAQRWQTRKRPLPPPCSGPSGTSRPCWRWMARRWTPCCVSAACCATVRAWSWLAVWPPCSI